MSRRAPQSHVAALLPALCSALATWPGRDPEGRRAAAALYQHLRAEIRASLAVDGVRGAAHALGVSPSTLQRWQEPGACLAPSDDDPGRRRRSAVTPVEGGGCSSVEGRELGAVDGTAVRSNATPAPW